MSVDVLLLALVFLLGFEAGGWAMLNWLMEKRK
jgi:hypothetical protein